MAIHFPIYIVKLFHLPKGRCNEAATCDVMMDKSKYFYRFVKFRTKLIGAMYL